MQTAFVIMAFASFVIRLRQDSGGCTGPLEYSKGTILRRLNLSCAWSRLKAHDPHYRDVIETDC